MTWIEALAGMGARTPDSEAALHAIHFIRDELVRLGLRDVRIEEAPTVKWTAAKQSLSVAGRDIPCSPIFHTSTSGRPQRFATPSGGLQADAVYLGRGAEADFGATDVGGKIVVCDAPFAKIRLQDHEKALYVHDPRRVHGEDFYLNCYDSPGEAFPHSYYRAQAAGAAGYVGILVDYYRERHTYANEAYTAYEGHPMRIPGLWVSAADGERIRAMAESRNGSTPASLVLEGELAEATSRVLVGVLPGSGDYRDESVIVDAHYDSISDGAVQDASGCAASLAIADYFSRVPPASRNRSLVFAFNDTHFTDYAAHAGFVERDLPELQSVFAVSIEHIGLELVDAPTGPTFTGRPSYRIIWTSPSPHVVQLVKEAVVRRNLEGAVLVSSDYDPNELGADTSSLWAAGIPVVSHLGVPTYLYDDIDTVDKVAQDQLRPTVEAFIDILEGLEDLPKASLGHGRTPPGAD